MAVAARKIAPAKKLKPLPGSYVAPEINGVQDFYISIPTDDLINGVFRRNEHQRDEEERNLSHLKVLQPEHRTIQVLQGYNGELILVDAHSRWFVWLLNRSVMPDVVHVHVFDVVCPSVDLKKEELRLYESCDSRRSVKTAAHTVQGAMNSLEMELETTWLKRGGFSEAIKAAARFVPGAPSPNDGIKPLIAFFRNELEAIDSISPSKGRFVSPFLTSAVIVLRAGFKRGMQDRALFMLTEYDQRRDRHFSNGLSNALMQLDTYRDVGFNGQGELNKGKGRFPTNSGDMDEAVLKIAAMMNVAVLKPKELLPPIEPCRRPALRASLA